MAINISTGHGHASPRPPLMRPRGPEHEGPLAVFMVALILVGVTIGAMVAPGGEVSLPGQLLQLALAPQAPVSRPTDGALPAPVAIAAESTDEKKAEAVTPAAAAAPVAVATQAALPSLAVGKQAQVVNTDGQGVVLHTAPQTGARRPSGLLEGVQVTVLELRGDTWARVESSSRKAGWVPVAYLAPVN